MGCSWTEGLGDELDLGGWAGRLRARLGPHVELVNLAGWGSMGRAGDSNWLQYLNLLEHSRHISEDRRVLVVWGLTAFSRMTEPDPQRQGSFRTLHSQHFTRDFLGLCYHDTVQQMQHSLLIWQWQEFCTLQGWQHLCFVSFDDRDRVDGSYWFDMAPAIYSRMHRHRMIQDTTARDYLQGQHSTPETLEQRHRLGGQYPAWQWDGNRLFAEDGHPSAQGYELWTDLLWSRLNQ